MVNSGCSMEFKSDKITLQSLEGPMNYLLTLLLVLAGGFTNPQSQRQPAGEIKGTVTDQDGRPVSSATVYAVPQALTLEGSKPRSAKADKDGKFLFGGRFRTGTYVLYSRKEEEGYPD